MREAITTAGIRPPGATPGFNVVIIYEDLEAGKRARKTYDYLAEQLGHHSHFNQAMWKFDVLAIPQLRDMAAKDVAEADILVISSSGEKDIPPGLKDWIEHCLRLAIKPMALVALFVSNSVQSGNVRSYLADVARRGRMKFFSHPDPLGPQSAPVPTSHLAHPESRNGVSNSMRHEVSIPRWGINE
jgi:hypothetical protein